MQIHGFPFPLSIPLPTSFRIRPLQHSQSFVFLLFLVPPCCPVFECRRRFARLRPSTTYSNTPGVQSTSSSPWPKHVNLTPPNYHKSGMERGRNSSPFINRCLSPAICWSNVAPKLRTRTSPIHIFSSVNHEIATLLGDRKQPPSSGYCARLSRHHKYPTFVAEVSPACSIFSRCIATCQTCVVRAFPLYIDSLQSFLSHYLGQIYSDALASGSKPRSR